MQEKRRRRIKKLQWQLQWRGMGSKLEKGIEGKKMKDLGHRSQSLGTKSVSHKPIFLIFFFLFFFLFLLVCTGLKHLYGPKQLDFADMRPLRPVFFPVWLVRDRYGQYFFRYETRGVLVPVHQSVWYIPAIPANTVRN